MSEILQNGELGLYSSRKSFSSISLKNGPEMFSVVLPRFGKGELRKRFSLPKVGLIPHFAGFWL